MPLLSPSLHIKARNSPFPQPISRIVLFEILYLSIMV